MAGTVYGKTITLREVLHWIRKLLSPEKDFYWLAGIYGIGISLLSLATPISVQMLINTIANTGLKTPLVVLSLTLFGLLLVSGLLNGLRIHLMEIFGRRFYARLVSEIALRSIYSQNPYFLDSGQGALFNRYFDIVIVQKSVPSLLVGGFTVILQAVIGFALVSFYHPLLLVFNLVLIVVIWLVWVVWGRGAVHSAVELSRQKHKAAAWLEGLGASNGFFKSERHIDYALRKTDEATRGYVEAHRGHFRNFFSQTVCFLVIYAAASAALLGLGGWLVIQGQLTLGQLVAAELVLSAVFLSLSQLGVYLTHFYDLCASIEELSLFYGVEQEEAPTGRAVDRKNTNLIFSNVRGQARGGEAILNLEIPGGAHVMAGAVDHGVQRLFQSLLRRHVIPERGYISFGGADILSTDVSILRREIMILDRPNMLEMTIREYLQLSCETVTPERIEEAIRVVGLDLAVSQLPDGMDTLMAPTGAPLSITEALRLKLAAAMLARPKVLVLNQLFDALPAERMISILEPITNNPLMTVIYFSNRTTPLLFDTFLYLDREQQALFHDFNDFKSALNDRRKFQRSLVERSRTPQVALVEQVRP